jgi:hypothetical protein
MHRRCTSWCVVIGLMVSVTVSSTALSATAQSAASPADSAPPVPPPFDIDAYVEQMSKPSIPLDLPPDVEGVGASVDEVGGQPLVDPARTVAPVFEAFTARVEVSGAAVGSASVAAATGDRTGGFPVRVTAPVEPTVVTGSAASGTSGAAAAAPVLGEVDTVVMSGLSSQVAAGLGFDAVGFTLTEPAGEAAGLVEVLDRL